METYLKLFESILDNDGKMALGIVYDDKLKEYHDNAYAVLRYKLTNIHLNMVCFCGVHIYTENQYKMLLKMLDSWQNQYLPVEMYLSISHNKEITIDLQKYQENIHIYIQKNKTSQFMHYKFLLNNIKKKNNQWIYFSNYNDIWNKNRSCAFNTLVNLYNISKFKDDKKPLYVKYAYVDVKNPEVNHNQFCCKIKDFEKFMNNIDLDILENDMCALYFIKFLNLNDETHLEFPNSDLFGVICECNMRLSCEDNSLRDMMILYFSKRNTFKVDDFENFWKHYNKNIDFNIVKKKCLDLFNNTDDFTKYKNSVLIIDNC